MTAAEVREVTVATMGMSVLPSGRSYGIGEGWTTGESASSRKCARLDQEFSTPSMIATGFRPTVMNWGNLGKRSGRNLRDYKEALKNRREHG